MAYNSGFDVDGWWVIFLKNRCFIKFKAFLIGQNLSSGILNFYPKLNFRD